jgi:hypothetical protein
MNGTNEPEPGGPHDPMHDAPRRLREEPEQRSAAADDIRALRENRPETVGRTISPLAPLDSQLENAVYEALRRPLDSHAMGETRALAGEIGRRGALFGVTGRRVASIGASGIIALFFLIMMPAARQPDSTQLFAAAVQSLTTALSQQPQGEDAPTPALAEFYSLLASGDTAQAAEREQPEKESDKVLERFLQWRQKANPSEAAQ